MLDSRYGGPAGCVAASSVASQRPREPVRRLVLAWSLLLSACGTGRIHGGGDGGPAGDAVPSRDARPDGDGGPADSGPFTLPGTLSVAARDVPVTPVGSARQPDVAFHGRSDAFVVAYTWVLPGSPTPRFRIEARAVTLDGSGLPIVSDPLMPDGLDVPHDAADAAAAAPSASASDVPALVLWTDDREAPGTPGSIEIYGRFVTPTGGAAPRLTAAGEAFAISQRPGDDEALPAAAWSDPAGRYVVAWADDRDRGVVHEDARVVYARTLAHDGTLGAEVRVGDEGLFQTVPQVAASGSERVLVVYSDYRVEGASLVTRYRGRVLDARTGAPLSTIATYGEVVDRPQEVPGVTWNGMLYAWIVAWTGDGPPNAKQIVTRRVEPDGATNGGPQVVTAQADGARSPRLAWIRAVNTCALTQLAQESTFGYLWELDAYGAHAAWGPHTLTPEAPPLGTFWSAVAAHGTRPAALAVMTLDYSRVHATTLLGPLSLP